MTDIDWATLRQSADDATKPVPKGEYDFVVIKAETKTASTGSPMIACTLRVTGGPSDGKNIFNNMVLSVENQFALARWFRTLDAFGLNSSWFDANSPSLEQIAAALLNRTVHGVVDIRQWQGQDRNEITSFSPSQSGPGGGPLSTTVGPVPGVPSMPSPRTTSPSTVPPVPSVSTPPVPHVGQASTPRSDLPI